MDHTTQKNYILVIAALITAVLGSGAVTGLIVYQYVMTEIQTKLEDPDFLTGQLEIITETDPPPPRAPALVRVDRISWKNFQPKRSLVGRLVEVRRVTVASEVTGRVLRMPVEQGHEVIGGQTLLAQVDDVWDQLSIAQSTAQVATIQAKLYYERAELQKSRDLRKSNVTTESEVNSRLAKVAELEAELAFTNAVLREAEERLTRTKIIAPFDGTVVVKHAELGQCLSPGAPVVDIISRGTIYAEIMVPESMIAMASIGDRLPVMIDRMGETVEGEITSITPYSGSASRTFPVRLSLDDQAGRFKAGMSVTILVPDGPENEGLVVSRDALLIRPDSCLAWVAIPLPGKPGMVQTQPVPVEITATMGREYAIVATTEAGKKLLQPDVMIVIEGAERLQPGQTARMTTLEEPSQIDVWNTTTQEETASATKDHS